MSQQRLLLSRCWGRETDPVFSAGEHPAVRTDLEGANTAKTIRRRRSSDIRRPVTDRVVFGNPQVVACGQMVPRTVGVVVTLPLTTVSEAKFDPTPPRGASRMPLAHLEW